MSQGARSDNTFLYIYANPLFSVKWVGLFVTALVGLYTIEDLCDKFGDLKMPVVSCTFFLVSVLDPKRIESLSGIKFDTGVLVSDALLSYLYSFT